MVTVVLMVVTNLVVEGVVVVLVEMEVVLYSVHLT